MRAMPLRPDRDVAFLNQIGEGHLPGYLGVVVTELEPGVLRAELPVRPELFAPNGFLHAGSVVTLADTAAGYACFAHLPHEALGFTTLELKANFLRTVNEGVLRCEARVLHMGRTTHVWDATVESGHGEAPIAVFRCTQLVLYDLPKAVRL
jgi:1,4-dihydroxy-2-naphthoyl-CoA hydrolase